MRETRSGGRVGLNSRGFTLVELLVVIGIIALLISILLPALNKARAQANTARCAANMRSAMQGVLMYTTAYNGWLPGAYTSGMGWNGDPRNGDRNMDGNSYGGDAMGPNESHTSTTPLQNFDWMSPSLGAAFKLPDNDVQRLKQLYTVNLTCPQGDIPFTKDFANDEAAGLAPSDFQVQSYAFVLEWMCWPEKEVTSRPKPLERTGSGVIIGFPNSYGPRMNKIGPTSAKAALVEGGRHIEADFANRAEPRVTDISFNYARYQHQGGNFAVVGYYRTGDNTPAQLLPTVSGSDTNWTGKMSKSATAYGWRHSGGRMNIAFFDGHVEALTPADSIKASLYLPKGSVIKLANKTLDPKDTNNQVIE